METLHINTDKARNIGTMLREEASSGTDTPTDHPVVTEFLSKLKKDPVLQNEYDTAKRAQAIFHILFPEVDTHPHIIVIRKEEDRSDSSFGNRILRTPPEYGGDVISRLIVKRPKDGRKAYFGGNVECTTTMGDLLGYFHEYCHAIFSTRTGSPQMTNQFTAMGSFDEGFAVTMELELARFLVKYSNEVGITPEEIEDITKLSSFYQRWLKEVYRKDRDRLDDQSSGTGNQNHSYAAKANMYSDGYYRLVGPVFRSKGIRGVLELLDSMDIAQIVAMTREQAEYTQALNSGSREERLAPFMTKGFKQSQAIHSTTSPA